MTPQDDHAHLLARLAEEMARGATAESTATAITERALQYVPDADWVSLTLRTRRDRYVTLASSHESSRRADELQYALREGPCVAAADGNEFYRSGDVTQDARWPTWGPKAGDLGVRSMLSVRLLSSGAPTGAINFYATEAGRFVDRDEVDFATLYASHVAIALSSSRQLAGLQSAIHSRHMIGYAQGILSERFGLDMQRSFDLLRRYSNDTNMKLSEVAEQVALKGRLPDLASDDG